MKEIIRKAIECDDKDVLRNVIHILSETCEYGLDNKTMLETLKDVHRELHDPHYDEEMCMIHVIEIGEEGSVESAKDYYRKAPKDIVNLWDWIVLWCEMAKRNREKIQKWFPGIRYVDMEGKIYDECVSYLNAGLRIID